ncbi:MAG: type II toxin-antitoxin system HicA family toxin [Solirubrobacteraceae bacterium]
MRASSSTPPSATCVTLRRRRLEAGLPAGSHHQFRHSSKPGGVTVAGKPADDLHPKTEASILKQAGLQR